MENQELIVKPQFDKEIEAHIKSVGEIESNMKEVKSYVENLNNYYKNITFTEETIKEAKEEKAKINKFKKQVADYRKNIVTEYNKPIKIFEDTAKETENLLTDTYSTINVQVANFENKQKQLKEQEVKEYFEEYKTANNIDFIEYEKARINVTLTASMKSLKEQAKAFIDKIVDDLNLIKTQEHKAEILVEYKQTLNVAQAITIVTNRFKAIEEEKKKQEQEKELQKFVVDTAKESDKYIEQTILNAPVIEEKQEEILTLKFTVKGTRTKLRELKQFLENGGYEYE
ncbi:MAG TPA: DUF1351 domain-containing protein [Clostridiaceae bacterium]|nr:DUF1351 domain-containing protein [Clostridiaceae bacterium]